MVALLIDHGAELEKAKNCGGTPLLVAVQVFCFLHNCYCCVLINFVFCLVCASAVCCFRAACENWQSLHKDVVALLIERGADVDKANRSGATALLYAAEVRLALFGVCRL